MTVKDMLRDCAEQGIDSRKLVSFLEEDVFEGELHEICRCSLNDIPKNIEDRSIDSRYKLVYAEKVIKVVLS